MVRAILPLASNKSKRRSEERSVCHLRDVMLLLGAEMLVVHAVSSWKGK
jgi:hypothetical protein